jgi:hypothetical protein
MSSRAQLFLVSQRPPSNPTASDLVSLGWNPSPDAKATGYFLCWGLASDACTNLLDVGNVTSATVAGLATNVAYYFTVVTYDAAGDRSPPSNVIGYTLDFTGIATPAVTWPTPDPIAYGTALGSGQLAASSPVPGAFAYNPPAGTVLNAGSNQALTVTFTPADTNSYVSVTTNVSINVLKKALTVTAVSTNKVYGAPLPVFSASYSGFVNGDTANDLSAQPVLSAVATATSPAGSYAITVSGASSTNYAISPVDGTLTINQAGTTGSLSSSGNPSLPGQPVAFTLTLNAVAPSAGLPTGTVQFVVDATNVVGPVSLSGGAAVYSTSNLVHGSHSVMAKYAGDGNFTGTTNLLSPAQLINTPPVAGTNILWRDPTNGVKIAIAALLANCSDADGDLIAFLGASTNSANGGTVVSNSGWIFYTPAPGSADSDSFTYVTSNGWGAPVTGSVTVNVRLDNGPSPSLTVIGLGNGSNALHGNGIPNRTYRIQFRDTMPTTNWQTLGTVTSDPSGIFLFLDCNGAPQRCYRSLYP